MHLIFLSISRYVLRSSIVNASRAYILYRWKDPYIFISSYHTADSAARIPFHLEGVRPRYSKHYSFCTLSSHLLVSMVIRRGVASPVGRLAGWLSSYIALYIHGCTCMRPSINGEIPPTFCICNCPAVLRNITFTVYIFFTVHRLSSEGVTRCRITSGAYKAIDSSRWTITNRKLKDVRVISRNVIKNIKIWWNILVLRLSNLCKIWAQFTHWFKSYLIFCLLLILM